MKKISICLVVALVLFTVPAMAGTFFNDVNNGNGVDVLVEPNATNVNIATVTIGAHFSPTDKSTQGGGIKVSTKNSFRIAKPGEVFIATLEFENVLVIESKPFVVPANGKGPIVLVFENVTLPEKSALVDVYTSIDGKRSEWPCLPWDSKSLVLAKANSSHTLGTVHRFSFLMEGSNVSSAADLLAKDGWRPVYSYWIDSGKYLTLNKKK